MVSFKLQYIYSVQYIDNIWFDKQSPIITTMRVSVYIVLLFLYWLMLLAIGMSNIYVPIMLEY